jgi:hypothetical protein
MMEDDRMRFIGRRLYIAVTAAALGLFLHSGSRAEPGAPPVGGGEARLPAAHAGYQPAEWYVAGFGGYTIGHGFADATGTGTQSGTDFGNRGLADSATYGVKVGRYFPGLWNWLGVEVEGFNSTPHIKQSGAEEGTHLRVTTLGVNLVGRMKLWCATRRDSARTRAANWGAYQDNVYCPVQPYAGVGIGTFFARASEQDGASSDVAPGWNMLAGLRYFMNDHVALFGEYKHNLAFLDFRDIDGRGAGLEGWYQASHIVGGLSVHF